MSLESKGKIAAAFEQLLQKNSILKISVSDITAASGLSRQTFYNNFIDVYDLVYWMHSEHIREVVEVFWKEDDFCQAFESALRIMRAHGEFYTQVIRKEGVNSFQQLFCARNIELSANRICHVSGNENEVDADARFMLELYWHGASQMVVNWIADGMRGDPAEHARLLYESLPQRLRPYWPNKPRR